jgi:hypothetical protein
LSLACFRTSGRGGVVQVKDEWANLSAAQSHGLAYSKRTEYRRCTLYQEVLLIPDLKIASFAMSSEPLSTQSLP